MADNFFDQFDEDSSSPASSEPSNFFDQFDTPKDSGNFFDQFDSKPESTAVGAFTRDVAKGAVPTAAGIAGMAAGVPVGAALGTAAAPLLGPLAPAAPVVGGLAGAVVGGLGGGALMQTVQDAVLDKLGLKKQIDEQSQADEAQHPWAKYAADLALTGASFGFNPAATLAQRVIGAGAMGGLEAGSQIAQGEFDPVQLALRTAEGGVFTDPRRATQALMRPFEKVAQAAVTRAGLTAPRNSIGTSETPPSPADDRDPVGVRYPKEGEAPETAPGVTQGDIAPDTLVAISPERPEFTGESLGQSIKAGVLGREPLVSPYGPEEPIEQGALRPDGFHQQGLGAGAAEAPPITQEQSRFDAAPDTPRYPNPVIEDQTINRTIPVKELATLKNGELYVDKSLPRSVDVNGKPLDPAVPLSIREAAEQHAIDLTPKGEKLTKQEIAQLSDHAMDTWLDQNGFDPQVFREAIGLERTESKPEPAKSETTETAKPDEQTELHELTPDDLNELAGEPDWKAINAEQSQTQAANMASQKADREAATTINVNGKEASAKGTPEEVSGKTPGLLRRLWADESGSIAIPEEAARRSLKDRVSDLLGTETGVKALEHLSDYNHRVRLLQNDAEALHNRWIDANGNLPDNRQFYVLKRLFPGKRADQVDTFNKTHYDPLAKTMRENGIPIKDAGEYLYARHAIERNLEKGKLYESDHQFNKAMKDEELVGASGMSAKDAKAIVEKYENGPKGEAFKGVGSKADAMVKFMQDLMVKSGLESAETIKAWRDKFEHYASLRGFENPDEVPDFARDMGRGRDIRGPEVKQALGRSTKAENPLANLITQAYRTIDRAEMNRVYLSMAGELASLQRVVGPKVLADDLGVRLNKGRPVSSIDEKTQTVVTKESPLDQFGDNAVKFKVAGQPRYMVFDDPRLAEAVKSWSPKDLPIALRWVQKVTNLMKSMWTHYSPTFVARHNARYFVEGLLNSFGLKDTGEHSAFQYVKEGFPVVGKAARAIFAAEGIISAEKGDADLVKSWKEMKQQGGSMSFLSMRDIDQVKRDLEIKLDNLGRAKGDPIRIMRSGLETLNSITTMMDNAQRLAAYQQARQQGMSPQKAALTARDATIDYALRGKQSNWMGLFQPFFNTALRTGARMWEGQARSQVMRNVFLGTLSAGMAAAAWNYFVGGKDTDGTAFFDKLPEWERDKSLMLMNPFVKDEQGRPSVIKFPFPYNWAFPLSTGYALGNMLWGTEPVGKVMKNLIFAPFLSTFTEVGETGLGVHSILPELARPAYDISRNKSWTGAPIHVDPAYQRGPNSYAGRTPKAGQERTGEGWKDVAKFLNSASGGSQQKSGVLDFYPEDIRYAFGSVFGQQGTLAQNFKDSGKAISEGKVPEAKNIPMAKPFLGQDYDAFDRAEAAKRRHQATHPWERH